MINFESSFSKLDSGCWIWTGRISKDGYGIYGECLAHRYSMCIYRNFDLSSLMLICHKLECNNKLCINPDHLYIGSNHDNMQDLLLSGNHNQLKKTHCPQGHPYSENALKWNGWRRCKICHKEREAKRREENKKNQQKQSV